MMKKSKGDDKCLKLRLNPWDQTSRDEVARAGHIARLDLTLKTKKSWDDVVQHLIKKWAGVVDICQRLQIFSTDEYGKPTLDFITSFSTFTVGNSLCTHPSFLHPPRDSIPTVELFYHLKVPLYPCTQHTPVNAPMSHFSQCQMPFGVGVSDPSPYFGHNNPMNNSFPLPLIASHPPSNSQYHPPLDGANICSTHQDPLYPLNTLSKFGYNNGSMSSKVQNDMQSTLGRRPQPTDEAMRPGKRSRDFEPHHQEMGQLAPYEDDGNRGLSLLGADTLQELVGGMFSPEKSKYSIEREIDEGRMGPLTFQNNSHCHSPLFDTSSQYAGQSLIMGSETMALFEGLHETTVALSPHKQKCESNLCSGSPPTESLNELKSPEAVQLLHNHDSYTTKTENNKGLCPTENIGTPKCRAECLASNEASIIINRKNDHSKLVSDLASNPIGSIVSNIVEIVTETVDDKAVQSTCKKRVNGTDNQAKLIEHLQQDSGVTPPCVTSHDVDTPRFAHISLLSATKCVVTASEKNNCPFVRDGARDAGNNSPTASAAAVNSSIEVTGDARFASIESSERACDNRVGNSLTSPDSLKHNDVQVMSEDCKNAEGGSHDSSTSIEKVGVKSISNICNGGAVPNKLKEVCVFTSLGCSARYGGEIPSGVIRRSNSKPHLKRINPTFIRELSRPVNDSLN